MSFPPIETLYDPMVLKELQTALYEVGDITPIWNEETQAWVFESPLYPVESEGETAEECRQRYPYWLAEFIKHRLAGQISVEDNRKTLGRGGRRPGAGRPKGTIKGNKKRIYLPVFICDWIATDPHNHVNALSAFVAQQRVAEAAQKSQAS